MSVLLADSDAYEVRRKVTADDAAMYPVPSYPSVADWTGEGYRQQQPDRTWKVSLDPSVGALSYDDEIALPGGPRVLVRTANLTPPDPDVVWDPVRAVDVTAVERAIEQHPREEQGGEPG